MRRIVSVCLPRWPIERLIAARRSQGPCNANDAAGLDTAPFALVEAGHRGIRLAAVNDAAQAYGIHAGDALADARAILPALVTQEAQPGADRAGLRKLALWLGRYGIARNAYGIRGEAASRHGLRSYGLWVDITGVAHLFGGEAALLEDMAARLKSFGLTARLGLADTLGAAHALAWCAGGEVGIAAPCATLAAIAALPVAGLRLDIARVALLHRLGLKTIGALAAIPRVALERRFCGSGDDERVLLRLDQALGMRAEPRRPLLEAPAFDVRQLFPEPLISAGILEREAGALVAALCAKLETASEGVRSACLAFYRSDGTVAKVEIRATRPTRAPGHLMGLLGAKLATLDLGFGVDLLTLEATRVEALSVRQETLSADDGGGTIVARAGLIDRLVNRLGGAVITIAPQPSHWPERSALCLPAAPQTCDPPSSAHQRPWPVPRPPGRPAILLSPPQPIAVVAAIPQGAPVRFIWRRARHRIVRAEGPERIEPEWWREIGRLQSLPRDYYALEDEVGGRFWVFRAGRYCGDEVSSFASSDCEPASPAWFIHGLFC